MRDEIAAVVDAYEQAWSTLDIDSLSSLWDTNDDEIYYVAEEIDRPFHQMSEVLNYWERTKSMVESVRMSTSDRRCRQLSRDIAAITYEMHVDITMQGSRRQTSGPVGIDVRVSALLRATDAGWRFIHYAEAPLGAMPFERRTYQTPVFHN